MKQVSPDPFMWAADEKKKLAELHPPHDPKCHACVARDLLLDPTASALLEHYLTALGGSSAQEPHSGPASSPKRRGR